MVAIKESTVRRAYYECACGEKDAYKFFLSEPEPKYPVSINCICGNGRIPNSPGMSLTGVEGLDGLLVEA